MAIQHHHPTQLSDKKTILDYNQFSEELAAAQYALGLLEGSQKKLHNPTLLISPLTAKEATASSKIEGTISTVSDVFLYEAGGQPQYSDSEQTQQVSNYRSAMYFSVEQLQSGRPLSPHLVQTLHGILMKNVRCRGPRGKFREEAVWIGERLTDPIDKAIYIPPEHHHIPEYMKNLFSYLENGKDSILIATGIAHYQFEAVHPFGDGNGRIGRLLIPLVLYRKNILSQPILYISGYLDEHKDEYISCLHKVDETGKYEPWLAFYFRAISEQLQETQELIENIHQLYDRMKGQFDATKSPYLIPFIDSLFHNPYFTIPSMKEHIGASARNTVVGLIASFEEANLVKQLDSKLGRAKFYVFSPLIDLL